jgi:hypothetical protein
MQRGFPGSATPLARTFCVLLAVIALPVQAATMSAEANTCGGFNADSKTDATAFASVGSTGCSLGAWGNASAIASEFGVGASAESYHVGGGGGVTYGLATVDTTFLIQGPGSSPIPVSLNLLVDGGFGGGYNANESSGRKVRFEYRVSASSSSFAYAFSEFGEVGEIVTAGVPVGFAFGNLAYGGTACLQTGCQIESPVMMLYPNVQHSFRMRIRASVEVFTGPGYGTAEFINTFYFPLGVDVFDLPDGYTADIVGLNVVNNRVVVPGGGEVPEPGTFSLMGASIAFVAVLRSRKNVSR